jgi:hypothetical protein
VKKTPQNPSSFTVAPFVGQQLSSSLGPRKKDHAFPPPVLPANGFVSEKHAPLSSLQDSRLIRVPSPDPSNRHQLPTTHTQSGLEFALANGETLVHPQTTGHGARIYVAYAPHPEEPPPEY